MRCDNQSKQDTKVRRGEKLPECDCVRHLRESEICQNAKLCKNSSLRECLERAKAAKMRPYARIAAWENAEREQKLQKCDRTREQGARTAWEDAEREQKLPKCDRAREQGARTAWENAE